MTSIDDTKNKPWWETELPAITNELDIYLKRHVPALRVDHDDLLSDTLLSLTQYIWENSTTLPQSWFNDFPPDREEQTHLHKLAIVILKRRIADNFRKRLASQRYPDTELNEAIDESGAAEPERRILFTKILDVVQSSLDEMPAKDRDLIALISQGVAPRQALNTNDRQRLHRIRQKLIERIARRLGADVANLLKAAK